MWDLEKFQNVMLWNEFVRSGSVADYLKYRGAPVKGCTKDEVTDGDGRGSDYSCQQQCR